MKTKIRTAAVGLLGLIAVALIAVNWKLLLDPASLHLLVGRIEAPLGLIVLLVTVVVVAFQMLLLRTRRLLASREHTKELERIRAAASDHVRSQTETVQRTVLQEVAAIRARLDRIDQSFEEPAPAPEARP